MTASGYDASRRPPVVTDADRAWAVEQKPENWDEEAPDLDFADFVDEQASAFERILGAERKSAAEWSGLWRRVWWPKADPAIRHPETAPHVPHPFIRADHPAWQRVLAVLDADERRIAERIGIMQFRSEDPRVAVLGRDIFTWLRERPKHERPRRARGGARAAS
jgi:hypothetical protein